MFELSGNLGFLDKSHFLAGIRLIQQVLDRHFPADVAVHGPKDCSHTASGNFPLDDVPLSFLGLAVQHVLERLLARTGRLLQRNAAIDPRFRQAAVGAVDLTRCNLCLSLVWCRNHQRLLAGRAPGRPARELGLNLGLHAAVGTGEGDHGNLAAGIQCKDQAGSAMKNPSRLYHSDEDTQGVSGRYLCPCPGPVVGETVVPPKPATMTVDSSRRLTMPKRAVKSSVEKQGDLTKASRKSQRP